jgi:hypothetical protein
MFNVVTHELSPPLQWRSGLDASILFPPVSNRRRRSRGPFLNAKDTMAHSWDTARVRQQADQPPNPFPWRKTVLFVYHVCHRETVERESGQRFGWITVQTSKH